MKARLDALAAWYETLTPSSLARIDEFYAEDVFFKDPFNEVRGRAAVRGVFEHMFETLAGPRFEVTARLHEGRQSFLAWTFCFRLAGGRALEVRGATYLEWDEAGRVVSHRDYWDAAEELYAKLPLLGVLMRGLRRRLAAPPGPMSKLTTGLP